MMPARHHLASMHRTFGRRPIAQAASDVAPQPVSLSDDARLFALTFAGGFLFMTVFLA